MHVLVIGGGVFGLTAALELYARRHTVTVVDPGPIPHPLAESTDISKVIRCDYGDDVYYTELGERAIEGWRRWNAAWPAARYHETGVLFVAQQPMQPGGFEHDSFALLQRRGHTIERLDEAQLGRRFPVCRGFVDGYFHAEGGWAEAARVVGDLVVLVRSAGIEIRDRCPVDLIAPDGAYSGLDFIAADAIVVCAGSWTQRLVPALEGSLRAIGQPVFHFQPRDPAAFATPHLPVFGADIARTGYYGFPLHRGVVKIANHGTGRVVTPEERDTCNVTSAQEADVRTFVRGAFPALVDAPITYTRLCVYGDTLDGHFWIAPHPEQPNLVVAAGGSGHAFKFAPVLGPLIADALEGVVVPRFRWRPELAVQSRGDAARSDHA